MEKQFPSKETTAIVTQGMQVRHAREEHGWSQSDLARRVGVSSRTVKRWESNTSSPHGYACQKLARVLDKSEEELALGKLSEEPNLTSDITTTHPGINEQPTLPPSPSKASLLLYGLYISVFVIGIMLYLTMRKLLSVLVFAVIVVVVLSFVVIAHLRIQRLNKKFIQGLWQQAHHSLVLLFTAISVVILIGATLMLSSYFSMYHGQSSSLSSPTSLPIRWNRLFRQPAPNCRNPKGVAWYVHLKGTSLTCNEAGLVMQQTAPHPYAEVDLVQINGKIYGQTTFRIQVQVTFQNPADTTIWAALLVQTPAAVGAVGGFIFTLSPNGQWQLQYVETASYIPIVKHGLVSINSKQAVTMIVEVQRNELYSLINNQQVASCNDTLDPSPGQVGLLVEAQPTAVPSSTILFSDFELDE